MKARAPYIALALLVLLLGWLCAPRSAYIGDPLAVRGVTWSMLEQGTLSVPAQYAVTAGQPGQYYVRNPRTGLYYSKYGVLNSLSYLPVMYLEKALYGAGDIFEDTPRRTTFLNVNNLCLSLILAFLLLGLAREYTDNVWLAWGWVVATLYASFGWNYLRAQTSELLQWLLATAFFLCLVKAMRQRSPRGWTLACLGSLALLCLTKGVYVLLVPVAVVGLIVGFAQADAAETPAVDSPVLPCYRQPGWTRLLLDISCPLVLTAALLLWINYLKFADPLASGYTFWSREAHFFSGNIWDGVIGFLFSPAKSIFIYMPLLLPAWLSCWILPTKERPLPHRAEHLLFALALIILLLFNSCTINWAGHWSYGPRYLLAVLAPSTLGSLLLAQWLLERWNSGWKYRLLSLVMALLLSFSCWMQVETNSLNFFTFYSTEALLEKAGAVQACEHLRRLPFGIVNYKLKAAVHNDVLPDFMEEALRETSPQYAPAMQYSLRSLTESNYMYWGK